MDSRKFRKARPSREGTLFYLNEAYQEARGFFLVMVLNNIRDDLEKDCVVECKPPSEEQPVKWPFLQIVCPYRFKMQIAFSSEHLILRVMDPGIRPSAWSPAGDDMKVSITSSSADLAEWLDDKIARFFLKRRHLLKAGHNIKL
jgi:hypothetical protein